MLVYAPPRKSIFRFVHFFDCFCREKAKAASVLTPDAALVERELFWKRKRQYPAACPSLRDSEAPKYTPAALRIMP
jgi:hypothetical protein